MINKFHAFIDSFLPAHIEDRLEVAVFYRARSVVISTLLGIGVLILLFCGILAVSDNYALTLRTFLGLLTFSSILLYLKLSRNHFEKALLIGSFLQVALLLVIIYSGVILDIGIGFFSFIWLVPVGLIVTFYFPPRVSGLMILANIFIVLFIVLFKHQNFYLPINSMPYFKSIFLLSSGLAITYSALLSFFLMQVNELLKTQLHQHKDLLLESAKFQSLGQMASNLAHDINNPLFNIQGKLHQMRNLFSQDKLDLEKCDAIVEDVESTILRLSQIVKGISTFARQSEGDQMVSIDVKELIRGIELLGGNRISRLGIELNVSASENLQIICYPSYISQVLINLINNAIDAVENVPVKKIMIHVFSKPSWIEFHVSDSGLGISPELTIKIFEPFFTTKKYGKGTGLGLSISKGLIKAHEGEIFYTRQNQLTTFVVRLPSYE
jgi:signal transduction histidine kinase